MPQSLDVAAARRDGVIDQQIAEYLAQQSGFNLAAARRDGVPDAAIVDFLNNPQPSTPQRPDRTANELIGDRSLDLASGIAAIPGMLNDPSSMARGIGGLFGADTSGLRTNYLPFTASGQQNLIGLLGDLAGKVARGEQSEARQYNRENAPWYDADNLIGMGLESLPSMVVPAGAGLAARGMGLSGRGAAGVMAAVEGGQGALMSQQSTVERLMADGYSRAEAERAAVLPSLASGVLTGATGKLLGGFESSLLSGAAGDIFSRGAIGGAARGILSEAPEEAIQSGGEQFFSNVAERMLNPEQNLMEGVGTAALQGGVLGGLMGGGIGGVAGGFNRPQPGEQQLQDDMIQESLDQRRWNRQRQPAPGTVAPVDAGPVGSLSYDQVSPQSVPPTPAPIRQAVDQVSWREQVAPVLDQMAQGNYETLLAEQQDRLQAIEKARAGKKRQPKPLPDPIPPRPESQLTADPFTPEMGAELIRSTEAGPVTPSMLKDKGIPRPADTLKILERRGFLKKTGTSEATTKLKNGKTRTTKEPVYESTAAKPPEVAGPGEGTMLYIKPVPVQEQAPEGTPKGPTPQAIKARFDAARARADDTRGKLAALPQVGEDWSASRIEAMDSRRKALEDQLQTDEFELARSQTGRAAFAVVEKISAPDGAPRENAIHTFPTRKEAQQWLDAKQGSVAPDIQSTPENKTAGRDARQEKALKGALKGLGLSDEVVLKVENSLGDNAGGYAETSQRNEEGQSIEVLIALSRDVYDPSLSDAENLAMMMETLHHEAIHALKKLGKFTPQEWNLLGKEARARKKDGKDYTYLQWAHEKYRDTYFTEDGKPDTDAIVEEAVAEMTKDWYRSGGKLGARYTGLMNKIVQFFKQLLKMQRADSVLTKVVGGEVGARTRQAESGTDQRMFSLGPVLQDKKGKPLTFYHGTNAEIDSFLAKEEVGIPGQRGIYFTKSPGLASIYAERRAEGRGGSEVVYPVHLSMKNPLIVDAYKMPLLDAMRSKIDPAFKDAARKKGFKESQQLRLKSAFVDDNYLEELKAAGYDGIINNEANEVVVFDQSQIQFAIAEPPVASDRRFSFASTKSQRPPRDNYNKFLKMEKAGGPRGTIYLHTGWFRGPDGIPRYEISDNEAALKGAGDVWQVRDDLRDIRKKQNVGAPSIYSTLGEVLDHPELFEAYPFLRDVKVEFADKTPDVRPFTVGNAAMTPTRRGEPPERILVGVASGNVPRLQEHDVIKSVLLHEIQHAIQGFEGMAGGGNPGRMADLATVSEAVRRRFESVNKELLTHAQNSDVDGFLKAINSDKADYTPEQFLTVEHLMGALKVMGIPPFNMSNMYNRAKSFVVYKSLYGETEARNTESRINMTPAERLREAPWRTMDVNENLGISMTLDEKNALLAQVAAKKAAASGVSHYNARNGFTPLETIENLQALAEKNRAAGLNDMADEMLEMASFIDPVGIRPDNIPRISDRRFSYAGARIHSRLGQVINAQTTKKATAQQWLKTLQSSPGVTKDELDWVGITELFDEGGVREMTLEELKEFFEDNSIVLVDRKRGPGSIEDPVDKEMFDAMVEEAMKDRSLNMSREEAERYVTRQNTNTPEWDVDEENDDGLVANHSGYALKGGHTETELLITIPGRVNPKLSPYAFRAPEHFTEYNVLAHVRFKIRDDVNGVPTLFIEEIQSDWHQRLRRSKVVAAKFSETKMALQAEQTKAREFYTKNMRTDPDGLNDFNVLSRFVRAANGQDWPDRQTHEAAEEIRHSLSEAYRRWEELELLESRDSPPDAPFKNNAWVKLAVRRVILDAIDNGITQIGWTPGHIQLERYGNDPSVEGVGKFYDEVIPSIIGKEIKAYGAQIGTKQFDIPEGNHPSELTKIPARTLDAPTFHITPKMREVANGDGFRLYSKGATLPRGMTEADLEALEAVVEAKAGMPASQQAMGGAGAAEMAARYTIVQDYLAKGARISPVRLAEEDARDAIDRATTLTQDRMFPVRRMVSEVVKFGGRVTDTNDPVLADTLYTRRSQHKLEKAHENLYRPAYLAIQQIGATEADLKKLAAVSEAARLELDSSHVHPSEAVMNIYLYARHAPERNAFIERVRKTKKIDPDTGQVTDEMLDAGSGMTNEEAAAIMAWFDGYAKQSKVIAAAKKVDAILDYTRATREASGLSPRWDEIESDLVPRFEHYVPLRGFAMGNLEEDWFDGDQHSRTGKAYKVGGKEDRSMKGRQTYAGDMLANVVMQNQESIVRSEKVRVGQSLARFVRENPELTKDYLVELPDTPTHRVVVDGRTRMAPINVKQGADYFITKENGKDVVFEVLDKRLARSLSHIQSFGEDPVSQILSRMARLTRVMSQLQTSYNPEFLVANVLRDVQAAMIQSGQYSPEAWAPIGKKAMTYAAQAVAERLGKKDPVLAAKMERLSELGGLTGVYGLTSIEDQMQAITKELQDIDPQDKNAGAKALRVSMKMAGKGFKYLEDLNDAVEGATRLAVFESFREQGWSEERSAQASKDMTVNFNRKGEWGPYMNAAYMFFNAATQGTATLLQASTSPRVQKVIIGIIVAGALQEMLMSAMSPEDEYGTSEYDKIEDYILEKNMVFMLGNGNYLKIPMPLGYNVFHSAGRNMARVALGKSGALDAAASTGSSVLSAFNPFGTNGSWVSAIFPSVVRPVVETVVNTDFTGKPIHPQGMPGLEQPASQSFFPSASEIGQGVADTASRLTGGDGAYRPGALEVHPDDIDHMAAAYLGGMGRFVGRAANAVGFLVDPQGKAVQGREFAARDMPFYRSFAGNVSGASIRTSYDQLITPYLQFGKSVKQFEDEGNFEAVNGVLSRQPERLMIYDFAAEMERDRIKARREINEIQDDPYMDDASKVAIIKQLRDEEQVLMNLTIQQIREMERQTGR